MELFIFTRVSEKKCLYPDFNEINSHTATAFIFLFFYKYKNKQHFLSKLLPFLNYLKNSTTIDTYVHLMALTIGLDKKRDRRSVVECHSSFKEV